MRNSNVWDAFKGLYEQRLLKEHNNPDLITRWGENLEDLETQILCTTEGTPIPETTRYCDGNEEWGPMRWPYNSDKETCSYNNPSIKFIPSNRVKAIGTTWWDWKNKHTVRLGFDIDSIIGHSAGVGVSDEVIKQISEADVPYLDIILSTRGLGRHLYINFKEPYPISVTHHEHAAIARSLIHKLSQDTGIDMEANKDVCGGVMWIYHTAATEENKGYSPVKKATDALTADDVPINWQDHISVITGSRSKVLVRGWTSEGVTEGDELDLMSQERATVELDEGHHRVLDELEALEYTVYWVDDHHLCQTHTGALLEVYEKFDKAGAPLRGIYRTDSPGDDPGKPNCFMRPRINGGWDVYRFGEGTAEDTLWIRTGKYTHTTFNVDLTLRESLRVAGGVENPDPKLGYSFNSVQAIEKALDLLNVKVAIPTRAGDGRSMYIRERSDGRAVIGITKENSDKPFDFGEFVKTSKGWERLLDNNISVQIVERTENSALNEVVRALTRRDWDDNSSSGGAFLGWVFKNKKGQWVETPRENVKPYMNALAVQDIDTAMGNSILNSWEVVCEPFRGEYPGGRKWNRGAPQFKYEPAVIDIDKKPEHPWWDKYLNHIGSDLDQYIEAQEWTKDYGIECGGDYIKAWIACMFRYPFDKLPYLFMYGEQDTGKSMFHESISLLITRGVKSADRALTNDAGYNGELVNAVLAYVDEVDISQESKAVYNKLKAWTTGLTISIHAKYHQVFEAPNTLHFVQMANHITSLPVLSGDKRVTAFEVPPVVTPIPKDVFTDHMMKEAPHFMRTLIDWQIPDAPSRLRLPVIETDSKDTAIQSNEDPLESFISTYCHRVDGERIKISDLVAKMKAVALDGDRGKLSVHTIKRELINLHVPIGRADGNVIWVGNLTFDTGVKPSSKYVTRNKRLIKEDTL